MFSRQEVSARAMLSIDSTWRHQTTQQVRLTNTPGDHLVSPLPKSGSCVWWSSTRNWDLTPSLGSLCQYLEYNPWNEKKKNYCVLVEFPMFQFVPIAFSPVSGHCKGKSSPIFFTPPPSGICGINKIMHMDKAPSPGWATALTGWSCMSHTWVP